jgi:hypothetical protein
MPGLWSVTNHRTISRKKTLRNLNLSAKASGHNVHDEGQKSGLREEVGTNED